MKKGIRAILSVGCIAAILAVCAIGTASAATVSYTNGIESSKTNNAAVSWVSQISQTISVHRSDVMDFENRWYNEAGSAVDCRISYGGSQPYKCTGEDTTVNTGLAAGSYYPGRTSTLLKTSTVYSDAAYGTYNLLVNHQYVYGYTTYGAGHTQTMQFTVAQ